MDYNRYSDLKVRLLEPGIAEIVMGEEGKLPTATARAHAEMAAIWLDIDRDPDIRVVILRGNAKGFSAGGDMAMVEQMTQDFEVRARVWREARDLVYNMMNCSKIIVSAMHGPAVGAGLVAGLMADISIAAKNARLIDGHTRLGVAVSEVDGQDTWQRSTLAGALTSGSFKQLAQATDHVEAWLLSRYPEGVRVERSLTSFEDAGGIG